MGVGFTGSVMPYAVGTFHRFENGEETMGLLAETVNAVRMDMRVEAVNGGAVDQQHQRLRELLPMQGDVWLVFRERHGWEVSEVQEIVDLLTGVYMELKRLRGTGTLNDARLFNDQVKAHTLRARWRGMRWLHLRSASEG